MPPRRRKPSAMPRTTRATIAGGQSRSPSYTTAMPLADEPNFALGRSSLTINRRRSPPSRCQDHPVTAAILTLISSSQIRHNLYWADEHGPGSCLPASSPKAHFKDRRHSSTVTTSSPLTHPPASTTFPVEIPKTEGILEILLFFELLLRDDSDRIRRRRTTSRGRRNSEPPPPRSSRRRIADHFQISVDKVVPTIEGFTSLLIFIPLSTPFIHKTPPPFVTNLHLYTPMRASMTELLPLPISPPALTGKVVK